MKFTPKTEEELQAEDLLAEGIYPFTILECEETVSKSQKNAGQPMLKVKINVHGDDGYDYHVYDYVADWFMAHKFRHFFYAINRPGMYEAGFVTAQDLIGLTGYASIGIQKPKPGSQYGPKNVVTDYSVKSETAPAAAPEAQKSSATASTPTTAQDDDVPF
jgi:hypothetical protein